MKTEEIIEKYALENSFNIEECFYGLECSSVEELLQQIEDVDYDGRLHEKIESQIDIYTSDLWKWAAENYEYVDQGINEGLVDPSNGIISCLQAGQYCQISEEIYNEIELLKGNIEDEREEIEDLFE